MDMERSMKHNPSLGKRMVESVSMVRLRLQVLNIFMIQAFALNCSVYLYVVVQEKEQQTRRLLSLMGLLDGAYWLGNLLFDYMAYLVVLLLWWAMLHIYHLQFIAPFMNMMPTIFLCFGCALLSYAYTMSLLFSSANQVYKLMPIINYFFLFLLSAVLDMVLSPFRMAHQMSQVMFMIVSPFYLLNQAVKHMPDTLGLQDDLPLEALFGEQTGQHPDTMIVNDSWSYCGIMLMQALLHHLVLRLAEHYNVYLHAQPDHKKPTVTPPPISQQGHQEIQQENQRMLSAQSSDPLQVGGLSKVYPNGFQALDRVSWGVDKQEIMGLLGPNGAGKSTLFSIISGFLPRSEGQCDILDGTTLGVSPQLLGVYPSLSSYQHLWIMACIRGVGYSDRHRLVQQWLYHLQLQSQCHMASKRLSGGNRKRLSVGMSLVGRNTLLLLDEPSCGLDPANRRLMQTRLQQYVNNTQASVVLTTHSMAEAEYLCQKVAILVNGRLRTVGALQQLKSIYGDGYTVTIHNGRQGVHTLFQQKFIESRLVDSSEEGVQAYQIKEGHISFKEVFSFMEAHRESMDDFGIQQCSLEKIFLGLAREQLSSEI